MKNLKILFITAQIINQKSEKLEPTHRINDQWGIQTQRSRAIIRNG